MTGIFGYFDDPDQTVPAFDPGLEVPCPICLCRIDRQPVKTISLMGTNGNRSYFFRAHKHCWNGASDEDKTKIEHSLIDSR